MKASVFSLVFLSGLAAAQIPACATSCITQFTTGDSIAGCGQLDIGCICKNSDFLNGIACCLTSACDKAGQDQAVKYAKQICSSAGVSVPDDVVCNDKTSSAAESATESATATDDSSSTATTDSSDSSTTEASETTAADDSSSAPATTKSASRTTGSSATRASQTASSASQSSTNAAAPLASAGSLVGAAIAMLAAAL